ncbi:Protein-glutamate methylesterase [Saliniradius amylolyticus]|uniref:Protein-glutamate methylesterase/protein-glutamine glutaminase n=1 Tax=Saliniradius amylolyticus TaxID=2183582 RepID=A0A2S2E7B3_9ALTE|nr:chemotaxis response regulator protein-glutamate methylesterase [Saliniradius amylolyticus]AWL13120.1 Protein-glutamate methylesterase [Saliniradius amylolyticus]
MSKDKIRVLVVDDSAVVRQMLTSILDEQPDIEVIGAAADPYFAVDKMRGNWPDVITLDVEMPRMDGITFLRKIMASRPTPVVICSSLTEEGAETTLEAMSAGAVSIFTKPQVGVKGFLQSTKAQLVEAVRTAAQAKPKNAKVGSGNDREHRTPVVKRTSMAKTTESVMCIGTSTGGTSALEQILTRLPVTAPGMVIVQHMPEKFTAAFASRLDKLCQIQVKEAQDGDRVRPGLALIAPGAQHMSLKRSGAFYYVGVKPGPAVNRHCPSVDVLFKSAAKVAGKNAVGFILTGMGDDGARGLLEMREAGAMTYAQDEATSVVFGMPKEAIKRQAVPEGNVIPLDSVAELIVQYSQTK